MPFFAIWWLAVPFIINQRTCFKGGVYLYTGKSLAHLWFVLVGVILLFLSFVAWYIVRYFIIGIKISMWKLGLGGEWFWCLRSSSTSVPGEMLRLMVQLQARPHGEGSWADEFFYGECLQGTSVEGEFLGKFQSRETGRIRHSISCLWIVSGPRVLRHFGRTRESRRSSDAWNPQNFFAMPAHGLGGPS